MSEAITIGQWLKKATHTLSAVGVELPDRTAQWLWQHASDMSLHDMVMHAGDIPKQEMVSRFWAFVLRRAKREPLQYIVSEAEFAGLSYYVDKRVLIPRADTEVLVNKAITLLEPLSQRRDRKPLVVDVGTGSGAIAITLARYLKQHHVPAGSVVLCATDISEDALMVARYNAKRHAVSAWITFCQGSYLEALPKEWGEIDLLVANPPYIPETEREHLQPEVVRWEPSGALFAGADGLSAYKDLLVQAQSRMTNEGTIVLEVGHGQADLVRHLIQNHWPHALITYEMDAQGIARVVVMRLEVC